MLGSLVQGRVSLDGAAGPADALDGSGLLLRTNPAFDTLAGAGEQARDAFVGTILTIGAGIGGLCSALLLAPKGTGPFPAALVLHDHGGKFDIGKEKVIAPWGDAARISASQAWADKYFSGRHLGDRAYFPREIMALAARPDFPLHRVDDR